jgi:phage N-6-adenine-methyltransferase
MAENRHPTSVITVDSSAYLCHIILRYISAKHKETQRMPDSLPIDFSPTLISASKTGINGVFYGVNEILTDSIHAAPNRLRVADAKVVQEIATSIEETGLQTPIIVRPGDSPNDFILVAGLHRLEAFRLLEREGIPAHVRDLSEKAARLVEITENLKRAELTKVQRDEQLAEYAAIAEEGVSEYETVSETFSPQDAALTPVIGRPVGSVAPTSIRQIAKKLGVTPDQLERAKRTAGITPEAKQAISDAGLKDTQKLRLEIAQADPEDQEIVVQEIRAGNHRTHTSKDFEWYTPLKFIEAARTVMGSIDLDPASCEFANETVDATAFYSEENDGLIQEWKGKVWMNPPYSQPHIMSFMTKLVEEVASGNVTDAITLTNNSTDTGWFHTAAKAANALCFTSGRIRFVSQTKKSNSPTQGQVFLYFGTDVSGFAKVFGEFGLVVTPHE